MKKKVFIPGVPTHSYQKGFNGNLLFYCLLDRLVYLTVFCTEVLRNQVTVLSLDLMFTHTHSLLRTASREVLSRFNQTVEMKYAQEFNRASGHKGAVFMKTYGWAQKKNNAKVRTCLAYMPTIRSRRNSADVPSIADGISWRIPAATILFQSRSSSGGRPPR